MKTLLHLKSQIKFSLFLLLVSNFSFSQTLMDEKFEGTTLPLGWTIQSTITNDPFYTWTFYDDYDDIEIAESQTTPQNEWVVTPSYDLSSFSDVYLSFSPWMYLIRPDFVADTFDFKVLVSTNNGVSWTEIWSDDQLSTSNLDGTYFYDRTISKSLKSFCGAGMTDVKIGFQYTSTGTTKNYNAVYLMDIKLSTDCPVTTLSTFSATDVSWFPINNFTGTFDIEYGAVGFVQGLGTLVSGLTGSTYTFPTSMCKYDFYIRSNCGGANSAWSKITFNNNIQDLGNNTGSTTNEILWTGYSTNYDIEYGINNFAVGNGTRYNNVPGFSYTLNNLIPNNTYKYYIRSNCGGVFGSWKSMTFTTKTALSVEDAVFKNSIKIFPNPAKDFLSIQNSSNNKIDKVIVVDITGKKILEQTGDTKKLNVSNLTNGVYLIQVFSENLKYQDKFIKL
jgi:hypothetical protein